MDTAGCRDGSGGSRIFRRVGEKLRIVKLTLEPGTSLATPTRCFAGSDRTRVESYSRERAKPGARV
jgi:hypothetical protein